MRSEVRWILSKRVSARGRTVQDVLVATVVAGLLGVALVRVLNPTTSLGLQGLRGYLSNPTPETAIAEVVAYSQRHAYPLGNPDGTAIVSRIPIPLETGPGAVLTLR